MDRCSTCKAPIRWVSSVKGRPMPIDPDPVDRGNLLIEDTLVGQVARVVPPGDGTHQSHFASCAHAAAHRRSR